MCDKYTVCTIIIPRVNISPLLLTLDNTLYMLRCIDISAASFIYHVASPSQFSIVTGKQEHVMQAHNEEAMMYWLTQLQVTTLYTMVTMVLDIVAVEKKTSV